MDAWADLAHNDGRGRLAEDVGDEEDERDDGLSNTASGARASWKGGGFTRCGTSYIAVADELQLLGHAGDVGSAQIRPVHERHAVHEADGDDEAAVDAPDDV